MKAFTERNYLLIFKVEKTIFCNVSAVVVAMSNEKNFFCDRIIFVTKLSRLNGMGSMCADDDDC